jgi:hypothetical protein
MDNPQEAHSLITTSSIPKPIPGSDPIADPNRISAKEREWDSSSTTPRADAYPPEKKDLDHTTPTTPIKESVIDIEHVPVTDDPREWSSRKKVSFSSVIPLVSHAQTNQCYSHFAFLDSLGNSP